MEPDDKDFGLAAFALMNGLLLWHVRRGELTSADVERFEQDAVQALQNADRPEALKLIQALLQVIRPKH